MKAKGIKAFTLGDERKTFEGLMFKRYVNILLILVDSLMFVFRVKTWDLKLDLDEDPSRYFPCVFNYFLKESANTETLQLWSQYWTPLAVYKKYHDRQRDHFDDDDGKGEEVTAVAEWKPVVGKVKPATVKK